MEAREGVIERYREFIGDNALFQILLGNERPKKPGRRHRERRGVRKQKGEEEPFSITSGEVFSFSSSPPYIKGTLRDYQIEGLNWLINMHESRINGILADEMGLGKTLQTISLLGYVYFVKKQKRPNLLIVPKSTLQNWKNEFSRFLPDGKTVIFHCSRKDLRAKEKMLYELDYIGCITTYEMCLAAKSALKAIEWEYIVIDEAHRIKNEETMISKVVRVFPCEHRLLLTGTPLQNNIHELWALLNFLAPEVFSDGEGFDAWVQSASGDSEEEAVDKLRNLLQLFILRREKSDVEKSLLPKQIINLYAPLTDMQRRWYRMILEKDMEGVMNERSKVQLMNIVTQLRKCCNHPYLFDGAEPGPPYTTDEHIVQNSGKLLLLDKLLQHLKQKGSRVLIFSQMTRMLDILEDYCNLRDYEYCRIDGSTQTEERCAAIEEFNQPGSEVFVFLLSTRAGGLGINLATADVVIIYDNDWNPQMDLQAQDRAHRIGQKKQVYVFNLLTENTVEEKILERALRKLKLDEIIVQNGKKRDTTISQNELLGILVDGVERVFADGKGKDQAVPSDRSIEEFILIGKERTESLNTKLGEQSIAGQLSNVEAYEWEGEDYSLKGTRMKLSQYISSEEPARNRGGLFGKRKALPGIRQYALPEHQFFPPRLHKLQEKELEAYRRTGSSENLLTPEEEAERKKLYEEGFTTWSRRDFCAYVRGCEKYGRAQVEKIAGDMPGKSLEEVAEYGRVFWMRMAELPDADKIRVQVQRGEHKLQRQQRVRECLREKVLAEGENLRIAYPPNGKSVGYTEDADRFILLSFNEEIGRANCYERIWRKLRMSKDFQFDYYARTRLPYDIQKRVQLLATGMLREKRLKEQE